VGLSAKRGGKRANNNGPDVVKAQTESAEEWWRKRSRVRLSSGGRKKGGQVFERDLKVATKKKEGVERQTVTPLSSRTSLKKKGEKKNRHKERPGGGESDMGAEKSNKCKLEF